MLGTVLSVVMLGGFAMLAGAFYLWRKGGMRKQVVLMVVLAAIAFANVAIWTVPSSDGTAPIDEVNR